MFTLLTFFAGMIGAITVLQGGQLAEGPDAAPRNLLHRLLRDAHDRRVHGHGGRKRGQWRNHRFAVLVRVLPPDRGAGVQALREQGLTASGCVHRAWPHFYKLLTTERQAACNIFRMNTYV